MAGSSKGPFTVPDPLGPAQDEADARQRRYNEAQATAAERRRLAFRQIEDGAKRTGEAVDAVEAGAATHAALSGNAKALQMAKRLGRRAGPIGKVATGVEAVAGGAADRADGMPLDEVIVRRGGRVLLGGIGTGLGAVGGGFVGSAAPGGGTLAVGAVGGIVGGEVGEHLSNAVADAYVRGKEGVKRTLLPYTDPYYMMRAMRGPR